MTTTKQNPIRKTIGKWFSPQKKVGYFRRYRYTIRAENTDGRKASINGYAMAQYREEAVTTATLKAHTRFPGSKGWLTFIDCELFPNGDGTGAERGTHHIPVRAHTRGGVQVKAHTRTVIK